MSRAAEKSESGKEKMYIVTLAGDSRKGSIELKDSVLHVSVSAVSTKEAVRKALFKAVGAPDSKRVFRGGSEFTVFPDKITVEYALHASSVDAFLEEYNERLKDGDE